MTRIISLVLIPAFLLLCGATAPAQEAKRPAGGRPHAPPPSVESAKEEPTAAQERRSTSKDDDDEARSRSKPVVLQLQNADCNEVAHLIEVTFGLNAMPLTRTNAVICNCSPEDLSQIRELLAQVDVAAGEDEQPEFAIIAVQQRRVDEIADTVSNLLAGRTSNVRIAKDRGRSALVVRGTKSAIEKVRAIVQQLDAPAGSVGLEFAFFRADAGSTGGPVNVPTDLTPVAEELKKFGSVELAGRLTTVAVENDKFSIEGAITETMPRLRVYGEVVGANAAGAVKLKVMAGLSLEQRPRPGAAAAEVKGQPTSRPARGPEFELETSVQTKRGDYVVLGSAPAGGTPGESVILVLHVRE